MAATTTPEDRFARRRRDLLRLARREAKADAFLITRPVDVSYLSGFSGEDSALLVGKGWSVLVTDFRFGEQAPVECPGTEVSVRPAVLTLEQQIAALVRDRRLGSLGVQQGHMTLEQRSTLDRATRRVRLLPFSDVVTRLRVVKDEEEIALTRKAVRIAERAFRELTGQGAKHLVGRTERELAGELEWRMRTAGADGASFDMIVAAGPNGSMCHYRPGNRKVRKGDPILFDWGAELDGYRSDITRVVFTGEPSATMREIYGVTLAAHDAAVAAIRPGARCKSLDRIARDVIDAAGYGEAFGHGLGHGIGREIHEFPRLSRRSNGSLQAGAIVTVEPGIYLPGVGGVRIEDDILVTPEGNARLNRLPRRLESMIVR